MAYDYFKRILKTYGLSRHDFLTLLVAQESKCAVCERELVLFSSNRKEIPVVDHHHGTLEVRGLLCTTCNVTIGFLEKDEYRTYSGLAYLGNPQDKYPRLRTEAKVREAKRVSRSRADLKLAVDALEKLLTAGPPGGKL